MNAYQAIDQVMGVSSNAKLALLPTAACAGGTAPVLWLCVRQATSLHMAVVCVQGAARQRLQLQGLAEEGRGAEPRRQVSVHAALHRQAGVCQPAGAELHRVSGAAARRDRCTLAMTCSPWVNKTLWRYDDR